LPLSSGSIARSKKRDEQEDHRSRRHPYEGLGHCRRSFVDQHRLLWTALLTGGAAPIVREELLRQGRDVSSTCSLGESWLPAGLGLVLAVSTIIELIVWWLRQAKPLPAGQIAEILDRVAISPTKATKAPTALGSRRKTVARSRQNSKRRK
jgi:hypothetical protein